jgi:hypothetical protein
VSLGKSVLAIPKTLDKVKTTHRPIYNYQKLDLKKAEVVYSLTFPKNTKTLYIIYIDRLYKVISDGKKVLLTTASTYPGGILERSYPNMELQRIHEIKIDGWTFKDSRVKERDKSNKRKRYQNYGMIKVSNSAFMNLNADTPHMFGKSRYDTKYDWKALALSKEWIARYFNHRVQREGRRVQQRRSWYRFPLDRDQFLTLKAIYDSIQKGDSTMKTLRQFEKLVPPETSNRQIKDFAETIGKMI